MGGAPAFTMNLTLNGSGPACGADAAVPQLHPTGSNRPYVRTPSSPIRSLRSTMGVDQGQGKAVSQVDFEMDKPEITSQHP
jgi:hypothetical protein